jgi:hypothetical protein
MRTLPPGPPSSPPPHTRQLEGARVFVRTGSGSAHSARVTGDTIGGMTMGCGSETVSETVSAAVMSEVARRGSTMGDASLSGMRGRGRGSTMGGGRPRGGIGSATLSGGTVGGGSMRGVGGKSGGGGLLLHERGNGEEGGGAAALLLQPSDGKRGPRQQLAGRGGRRVWISQLPTSCGPSWG